MPRQARIDAPGALQHIIVRGIERKRIFVDDQDRDNFVDRLGTVLPESSARCYAWALIPNHFHLLLCSGNVTISTVMRRLLTGYALSFNRRHRRHGPLFQNRYKSILCQQEPYLLELVRYIHLNPIRAGVVANYKALGKFAHSGHAAILGQNPHPFQDVDTVLMMFARNRSVARKKYSEFVHKGISHGHRPELIGGGLIRSAGGWSAVKGLRQANARMKGDERILGDKDFVDAVLAAAEEQLEHKYRLAAKGIDFEKVVRRVAAVFDIKADEVLSAGKHPPTVKARSVLCYWAVRELGMNGTDVAAKLGCSQSSVSKSAKRGEAIASENNLELIER
ncbi:MAG: transposase [Desulfobacterales bacterium]|jgi:REP element-mobilizing transposase RayT